MPTQSVETTRTNQQEATMTADENAAIVRRGYEAFNSADVATLSEVFHENAVWHGRAAARWPVTTRGATQPWATSAGWGRRQAATSGPNCST
jgi:ketosteroid isomerase-like protein